MRQLGQLSSSQPDLGAPHSRHLSGSLTMPSVTSFYLFSSKTRAMLQVGSARFIIVIVILILLSAGKIEIKIEIMSKRCTRLRAQDLKKVTQLLINLFFLGHRVRDLAAQQFAITLPQPMHRDPHRAFAHIEALADLRISRSVALA